MVWDPSLAGSSLCDTFGSYIINTLNYDGRKNVGAFILEGKWDLALFDDHVIFNIVKSIPISSSYYEDRWLFQGYSSPTFKTFMKDYYCSFERLLDTNLFGLKSMLFSVPSIPNHAL